MSPQGSTPEDRRDVIANPSKIASPIPIGHATAALFVAAREKSYQIAWAGGRTRQGNDVRRSQPHGQGARAPPVSGARVGQGTPTSSASATTWLLQFVGGDHAETAEAGTRGSRYFASIHASWGHHQCCRPQCRELTVSGNDRRLFRRYRCPSRNYDLSSGSAASTPPWSASVWPL